ncbi:nuclear protein DGCR14 [Zychaea mexicana]|uniref:nuclear protein DGCR14 n=1 Tax=Zychaea mexicana TaxID=64656 RepID=UPI0022FF2B42|nr:nuclear protein DGCR14 [Zychaea mexicana]KAI9493674.1 nuclear protein DGCR14 [Zychaea mexicana]
MTTPVVLDEETYTEALSSIIERDFFPHLAKVKAQQNYLQAQQSGTLADLERASRALHRAQQTPSTRLGTSSKGSATAAESSKSLISSSSTPLNYYNHEADDLADRVNLDLSLDQFQTLYTSEDNASFTEILEKTNAKRREKYKWLLDKEKAPMITGEEKKMIEFATSPAVWKYTAKNALMYIPNGTGQSLLNDVDSRAPPKAISHNNTQFAVPEVPASRTASKTTSTPPITANGTPWKAMCGVGDDNESVYSDAKSDYRGYRLVDATPTLTPSRVGSPMMTWGSIEGTPMLISGSETPGPRFSLPKESRREQLGMKLSEKASRAHRKRANERVSKGTPRSGAGLASPAAQHLLRRSHTPRTSAFGDALRSSYGRNTPHGSRTPGATPTPLFRAGVTPVSRFQSPLQKKE